MSPCLGPQGRQTLSVADRWSSTTAEDGEVSGKSPAGAVIPMLAFSGGAERALPGPGLEEPGMESSYTRCAGAY